MAIKIIKHGIAYKMEQKVSFQCPECKSFHISPKDKNNQYTCLDCGCVFKEEKP